MTVRRAVFFSLMAMLAGLSACSGGRLKSGVYVRSGGVERPWKPRQILLLYPSVATDAVGTRDIATGTRPLMGSEMIALVHVNIRKFLGTPGPTRWKDASEPAVSRERLALLGTSIQREYRQRGVLPARVVGELYRASGSDAALMVSVFRYGRSNQKLLLRGVSGDVQKAGGTAPAGGWLNCGVKVTMIKTAQAAVAWEGCYLDSRPAEDTLSQEEMVRDCVAKIMEAFPYLK